MAELPRRLAEPLREIESLRRAAMPMEQLTALTLHLVRTALRADAIAMLQTDPATFLAIGGAVEGFDPRAAGLFFGGIYLQREQVSFLDLRARGAVTSLLSEYTHGKPEQEPRCVEVYGPYGIRHEVRACLRTGDAYWGGLCIGRAPDAPDFGRRELLFLRRSAPYLGEALRQAVRLQAATDALAGRQPQPQGAPSPAAFLLDGRGRVVAASRGADRVLDDVRVLRSDGAVGQPLPMALQSTIAALERARARAAQVEAASPELTLRGRSGRWWTVCALSPAPGSSPEVAAMVVVCPAGPAQRFARMAAVYGLTAQERRVVDLVARGYSTDEIARQLHVAAYTVQDHLKSVFDKTDVRSRRALLACLFHTESPLGRMFAASRGAAASPPGR